MGCTEKCTAHDGEYGHVGLEEEAVVWEWVKQRREGSWWWWWGVIRDRHLIGKRERVWWKLRGS